MSNPQEQSRATKALLATPALPYSLKMKMLLFLSILPVILSLAIGCDSRAVSNADYQTILDQWSYGDRGNLSQARWQEPLFPRRHHPQSFSTP